MRRYREIRYVAAQGRRAHAQCGCVLWKIADMAPSTMTQGLLTRGYIAGDAAPVGEGYFVAGGIDIPLDRKVNSSCW